MALMWKFRLVATPVRTTTSLVHYFALLKVKMEEITAKCDLCKQTTIRQEQQQPQQQV